MIITKTPLRIPIGGGGTDLPDFYKKYGSFFISAAINYYIYIAIQNKPIKGIKLGYPFIEEVKKIEEIKNPIVKASLKYLKIPIQRGLEIVSMGDIPAGTGLGSSGSFTVGLLNALHNIERKTCSPEILANQACYINMKLLQEPSGKQDEYIASYGGIRCFEINKEGKVKSYPLKIKDETINNLQTNLLMFYTGIIRPSKKALSKQSTDIHNNSLEMINNLKEIQQIGYEIKTSLEKGDVLHFATLLDKHWQVKKKREFTTTRTIDRWYNIAKDNGAIGGKLMGAGGGGFFVFYCNNDKNKLRNALKNEGLEEIKFQFDFEGSKLIINI